MIVGWDEVALGDLMIDRAQNVEPARFSGETFQLYSIPAFDGGAPVTVGGAEIGSAKQLVRNGDVLLSKIVPHIRRVWIVQSTSPHRLLASGEWIVFRGGLADPRYLRQVLVSDRFHAHLMSTVAGVGGSLMRARPAVVARIKIPLPPRDEQQRIAHVLDFAEFLRARRRVGIGNLVALTDGLFPHLIPPVGRLPLGELLDRIESGRSPVCEARPVTDCEWGVLKLGAVSFGEYRPAENKAMLPNSEVDRRHEVAAGDVLLARKNTIQLVGASAYVRTTPPRMLLPDLIFRLVPRAGANLRPVFLQAALARPRARAAIARLAGGSAGSMPNISKQRLLTIEIDLPAVEVQLAYEKKIEALDRLVTRARAQLAQLDALLASLQHRAFTGAL